MEEALPVAEYGRLDLVARLDAQKPGTATVDFQYRPHRELAGDAVGRLWLGIGMDVADGAVAADEHHVERDQRVFHPEADRRLLVEVEQHALIRPKLVAKT